MMIKAYLAIQCLYPATRETGSFLFGRDGEGKHQAVSPLFDDLIEIYARLNKHHKKRAYPR